MQWLATLIAKLTCFVPRPWLVDPDEAGVRMTAKWPWSGMWVRTLEPGLYWYVPLFQHIQTLKVKIQTEDMRAQSITTADGRPVIVSGAIQYRVVDAQKALLEVFDYDKNLLNTALGVIAKFVNGRTLEQCWDIGSLEIEILKGTREAASGWGLKIVRVFISDLVAAKTYRLIGGLSNEAYSTDAGQSSDS